MPRLTFPNMIESIQTELQAHPGGVATKLLAERTGLSLDAENQTMLELFCMMLPGVRKEGGEWKAAREGKTAKVIACLENHARATGKRIFRAGTALKGLPPGQHPTTEELQRAVDATHGQLLLLPNEMIKFNG